MKKLSIISVHDYTAATHTAYWEIGVSDSAPYSWVANIMDRQTGVLLESEQGGPFEVEDDARRASQEWVLSRIETYRRAN